MSRAPQFRLPGPLLLAGALLAAACGGGDAAGGAAGENLSRAMGEAQRHAAKLGHAIDARNGPLAGYYAGELDETLRAIARDHEVHEGYPVADLVRELALPAVRPVADAVAARDWIEAERAYAAALDTCNACHAATEKEFVVVLPADGPPRFFQRFAQP